MNTIYDLFSSRLSGIPDPCSPSGNRDWERDDPGNRQRLCRNRVQFETRRFQFRSSPPGRPWKVGTTGFKLDAVEQGLLTGKIDCDTGWFGRLSGRSP